MNVLSLFDGISCGQIASNKAGIEVDNYYASEIDKYAINVTQKHFPNTVQLGDVSKIDFYKLPKIDLLLGGSPCQGFSFAGKQLAFNDPRSVLFFEFAKAYRILKTINPNIKILLENVYMKQEFQDVISENLGVRPKEINSDLVSAQNRKRLYWSNFNYEIPEDKCIKLSSVIGEGNILVHNIYGGFKENKCRTFKDKSPTIRTSAGGGHLPSVFNGTPEEAKRWDLPCLRDCVTKITPEQCEMLQTLPPKYTEGHSNTQRFKMIGNGWTVDVIAHILSYLKTNPPLTQSQ